jgi:hypothetical protein
VSVSTPVSSLDPVIQRTKTSQCVDAVNVHGTTSANSLSATPPKCQSRVDLVLDPDQCVEHHGSGLVEVELVRLHLWLGGWLVGVPSVNVECLDLGALLQLRLALCRRLGLRNGFAGCIRYNRLGCLGNGLAGVDIAHGGETAGEGSGPHGYDVTVSTR